MLDTHTSVSSKHPDDQMRKAKRTHSSRYLHNPYGAGASVVRTLWQWTRRYLQPLWTPCTSSTTTQSSRFSCDTRTRSRATRTCLSQWRPAEALLQPLRPRKPKSRARTGCIANPLVHTVSCVANECLEPVVTGFVCFVPPYNCICMSCEAHQWTCALNKHPVPPVLFRLPFWRQRLQTGMFRSEPYIFSVPPVQATGRASLASSQLDLQQACESVCCARVVVPFYHSSLCDAALGDDSCTFSIFARVTCNAENRSSCQRPRTTIAFTHFKQLQHTKGRRRHAYERHPADHVVEQSNSCREELEEPRRQHRLHSLHDRSHKVSITRKYSV